MAVERPKQILSYSLPGSPLLIRWLSPSPQDGLDALCGADLYRHRLSLGRSYPAPDTKEFLLLESVRASRPAGQDGRRRARSGPGGSSKLKTMKTLRQFMTG